MTLTEMLEANSIPEPNSGCWLWLRGVAGGKRVAGVRKGVYPIWKWEGRQTQVSHLALKTRGVEVPKDFGGCHRCDNTFCVNPDHLFVGTNTDNIRDAQAKGRLVRVKRMVCKQGHPLSADNVYINNGKFRGCRICKRRRDGEFRARARHAKIS
jgi:hypothetical protein